MSVKVEVLVYLIPVALLMGVAGLVAFFWALKTGQFEDLDGAGMRILIDDEDALGADPKNQPDFDGNPEKNPKQTVDPEGEPK